MCLYVHVYILNFNCASHLNFLSFFLYFPQLKLWACFFGSAMVAKNRKDSGKGGGRGVQSI